MMRQLMTSLRGHKWLLPATALCALAALAWRDDAPDSEIDGFLALLDTLPRNDSFRYAMGFEAVPDRDPMDIGRYRISTYEAALEADIDPDEGLPLTDLYGHERYDLPDNPLFCRLHEADCLSRLKATGKEVDGLLRQHALLLGRYQTLLAMPDGRPDTPAYDAPRGPAFPARAVLRAGRLLNLSAMSDARKGNVPGALQILYQHLALGRRHLAGTDDMNTKLVYQLLVSETLEVIALVGSQHPVADLASVPALTPDEHDFSLPLARELRYAESDIAYYRQHPEALLGLGDFSSLVIGFLYKPQMTLNAVYQDLGASAFISRRGPQYLARAITAWDLNTLPILFRVRNLAGAAYLDGRDYSHLEFVGRVHDLDAKIVLFNAFAQRKGETADWLQLRNPYYTDARPPVVSPNGKEICFDGPLPDPFRTRCLLL